MNQVCAQCGHSFEAAGDGGPAVVSCPACGKPIRPAATAPQRRVRIGAKDVIIALAVMGWLALLIFLFLQPPQPARDLVFGDLGRIQPSSNNPALPFPRTPGAPPSPTNDAATAPPSTAPTAGPNPSAPEPGSLTSAQNPVLPNPAPSPTPTRTTPESAPPTAANQPRQMTPSELSNALASAMAAPAPVLSSADNGAAASAPPASAPATSPSAASPSPAAPVEGPLPVTASGPKPGLAIPPRSSPEPYTAPPTPEPENKPRTADLLKLETDAGGATPAENGPARTADLISGASARANKVLISPGSASAQAVPPDSKPSGASTPSTETHGGPALFDLAAGASVSFVLEQSPKMAKTGKTALVRNELVKTLESMGPSKFFYVLVFHSGGEGYDDSPSQGPVPATPYNIGRMTNWLISVSPRSGSDPSKAIRHVLASKPPSDTIWLVSDEQLSPKAVQAVRAANSLANVPINTVGFQGQKAGESLRQVASENRGNCRLLPLP